MPTKGRSPVIPCFRYVDAPAAIEWLCETFGFEKHLVVPGEEDGQIAHAQLTLGDGMIMLGSGSHDGSIGDFLKPRGSSEAAVSTSAYLVVDDPDARYQRAVAVGAEILVEIQDESYGGRGFSCRDPEGHVWSFGSYDPWAE